MSDEIRYLSPPTYRTMTGPWGRDESHLADVDFRCAVCGTTLSERRFCAAGFFGANGYLNFSCAQGDDDRHEFAAFLLAAMRGTNRVAKEPSRQVEIPIDRLLRATARGVVAEWGLERPEAFDLALESFIEWRMGGDYWANDFPQNIAPLTYALFSSDDSEHPSAKLRIRRD